MIIQKLHVRDQNVLAWLVVIAAVMAWIGFYNLIEPFANWLVYRLLSLAENSHLGESLGIPRQTVFDTLLGSIVAAPNLALKRGNIENNQYDTEFSLKWLCKDLQLATQTGYEQNIPMPVTNAAKEIYAMAEQAGLGEQDFSVIFKFLRAE